MTASTPLWLRTTARSTASSARWRRRDGFVDLSHRGVVRISGPDRLTWLHSLTTQYFEGLPRASRPRRWSSARRATSSTRSPGVDDGEAFTAHAEPGAGRRARRVPRPDAVHDAGRGRRRHRRVRRRLAPPRRRRRGLRPRPPRPARGVRRGGRPAVRHLGLRGAAHRPRRAAARARHRPPHDPQRGRLDRAGRAPRQGLLPRPGDRRARAHAGPAAAPADAAAPRRLREPAAPARAPTCCWTAEPSAGSAARPATTSWARSRWRWSSATSRSTPPSTPTACPRPRRSWSTPRSACTSARTSGKPGNPLLGDADD